MAHYKLSKAADADIEQIFTFGIDNFGVEQATTYHLHLKARLQKVADTPLIYQEVAHIMPGVRRSPFGSHSIYYRITNDSIFIIRILGRQDIFTSL